jgi:arsenite methyltransferase
MNMTPDALRDAVRDKYAAVARGEVLSCCGPTDEAAEINMIGDAYDGVDGYVADADLGLGCGLPVEHARLAAGQTVLDLGSGAGLDAFVARRLVGETGRVLGIDFTPEMVEKARKNAFRLGYANVEFLEGSIEEMPIDDTSVDVVISNCVLNLVPDKARAFAEMARVIRPGGHFCVSDIVTRGDLPLEIRQSAEMYAGCVAGAMAEAEYLELLRAAGFESVEIVLARPIALPGGLLPEGAEAPLWSTTVTGNRPTVLKASSPLVMPSLQIYDPAMCCSTGLCGPDPDAALVQFAADLKEVAALGVTVQRFNLAQEPEKFIAQPAVLAAVNTLGAEVLPLILRDGRIVSHGRYPSLAELREMAAAKPTPEPVFSLDLAPAGGCAPGSGCC